MDLRRGARRSTKTISSSFGTMKGKYVRRVLSEGLEEIE